MKVSKKRETVGEQNVKEKDRNDVAFSIESLRYKTKNDKVRWGVDSDRKMNRIHLYATFETFPLIDTGVTLSGMLKIYGL